jgi:hypothetical protein
LKSKRKVCSIYVVFHFSKNRIETPLLGLYILLIDKASWVARCLGRYFVYYEQLKISFSFFFKINYHPGPSERTQGKKNKRKITCFLILLGIKETLTMMSRTFAVLALAGSAAAFSPMMGMDIGRREIVQAGAAAAAVAPLLKSTPAAAKYDQVLT